MTAPTTVGFGGAGGSGYSGYFPWTAGPIGLPSGRAMGNGSTATLMTLASVLVGGNGAARTGSASLAGSGGGFSAPSGSPVSCGVAASAALVNGGSASLSLTASGSLNFGRAGGGTTNDGHTSFAGTLGGSYTYQQGPAAPVVGTPTNTSPGIVSVPFTPSTDDGGAAISTHRVEYSTDPSFSSISYVETTTSPATISGLASGVPYYFRVAARNAVTDAASTVGAYSAVASLVTLSGLRVGRSGSWVQCAVYVGVNGAWKPAQVYTGRAGAWVPLTP